jgi:hypothetical protein
MTLTPLKKYLTVKLDYAQSVSFTMSKICKPDKVVSGMIRFGKILAVGSEVTGLTVNDNVIIRNDVCNITKDKITIELVHQDDVIAKITQ